MLNLLRLVVASLLVRRPLCSLLVAASLVVVPGASLECPMSHWTESASHWVRADEAGQEVDGADGACRWFPFLPQCRTV